MSCVKQLRVVSLVLVFAVALLVTGCGAKATDEHAATTASATTGSVAPAAPSDDPYASGTHHVRIEVKNYGTIEAELDADVAPLTVANFCHLAQSGFYDNLTFHRIIKGFMIQGGDPKGNGTGGSKDTITGEFSANGKKNDLRHVRGTISMARSSSYDSASSQFFIMQQTNPSLDGQYAAFGTVTSGMDVVDAICEKVPVKDGNGTVAPADQPVMTSVTLVD